jgi:hypothetical protein
MMGNTMTAARRRRKLHPDRPGIGLKAQFKVHARTGLLRAAMLAASLCLAGPTGAATTEQVVVDRYSGLAISGFDPVAYFTDAQALPGKGEFEQVVAGAVWRFRSAGNQAAFAAHPDIYMPRFGGYDPLDIARGVAVAGNPMLWVIRRDRLYLFYTPEARDEFAGDSDRTIASADREWPLVQRKLVP